MKRNVLFVDHDTTRTGSTTSMEYLLRAFSDRGCAVFVLTPKRGGDEAALRAMTSGTLSSRRWGMHTLAMDTHFTSTVPLISPRGVLVLAKNILKFILGIQIVCGAIRKVRADLVYVNEHVMPQASLAARLCGVPAVMHVRSRIVEGRWGVRKGIVTWIITRCNRYLFAIGTEEKRQVVTPRGGSPGVLVVGEFVSIRSIEGARAEDYEELPDIPGGRLVVSMLGGILRIKGTITFLRAAERIASERDDVFFSVAGPAYATGNDLERQHYESCIEALRRLGEKRQGCYLGTVSNVAALIKRSAIVVAPSRESHFSRPIIEAWAAGKPVVACRTAHMEELVTNAVDGLLVPADDEEALSTSLRVLLSDSDLRQHMGSAGREKVRARFDADANTSQITDLCLGLMAE